MEFIQKLFEKLHDRKCRIYRFKPNCKLQYDFMIQAEKINMIEVTKAFDNIGETSLIVEKVWTDERSCFVNINRKFTISRVINDVMKEKNSYGKLLLTGRKIVIFVVNGSSQTCLDDLRSYLLAITCNELLKNIGCDVELILPKIEDIRSFVFVSENFNVTPVSNDPNAKERLLLKAKSSKYKIDSSDVILDAKSFLQDMKLEDTKSKSGWTNINLLPVQLQGEESTILKDVITLNNFHTELPGHETLLITSQKLAFQTNQMCTLQKMIAPHDKNTFCVTHGPVHFTRAADSSNDITSYFTNRLEASVTEGRHKYGPNVDENSWDGLFRKMTDACVKFDLLTSKASVAVKVASSEFRSCNPKGKFVMYNYARLSMILNKFQSKVQEGYYPPLPPIKNIDFGALTDQMEWRLVFDYLLYFPKLLCEAADLSDLSSIATHKIMHFLLSMSEAVSAYYSKVHVLIESKEHLLPIIFARLYLIQALKQVMANALSILHIYGIEEL